MRSWFLVFRECGLAHKTLVFVLDEFDLFAQVRLHNLVPIAFSVLKLCSLSFCIDICRCLLWWKTMIMSNPIFSPVCFVWILWLCHSYCSYFSLQGKQRVLYSLLDAMQSVTSQAVVIGVSCRLVWYFEVSFIYLICCHQVCSLLNYKITTECEAVLSWDSDEFNENKLEVLTIDVICRLCFLVIECKKICIETALSRISKL